MFEYFRDKVSNNGIIFLQETHSTEDVHNKWRDDFQGQIVKSLQDSGLLLKGVNELIQHEAKAQKEGFLTMLEIFLFLGKIIRTYFSR